MGLKETYESWQFRPIRDVPSENTPKTQAEGKITIPSASLEADYDTFQFRPVGTLPANATPKRQANGEVAMNFLSNDVQEEIRNRTPGNKVVTQATADNATNGTFKQSVLTQYYTNLTNNTLFSNFKSRLVHIYNNNNSYTTQTSQAGTPGVLNINGQVSSQTGPGANFINLNS